MCEKVNKKLQAKRIVKMPVGQAGEMYENSNEDTKSVKARV